jgi:histidinol-phosphate/aromatic aminotransferase/cobyric acid decarboxylase-like protein/imidazoleglycerol phosphate dehydratase HisB
VKALAHDFRPYEWAPSTRDLAAAAGLDPMEIVRFDGNVAPAPPSSARPGTIAGALARVHTYPHGGYPELVDAVAEYAGTAPENVVLGAGADDLILLCARTFAGAGDVVAIPQRPTYGLFEIAARLAGASVVPEGDATLTIVCRPNNPTGSLDPLPATRPLVVDEAYFEYAGETAVPLLDEGVVVIRTFSKAFGLAGARVGYALADEATAAELNARQAPAPVSTISAALALAALDAPPDVSAVVEERERLAAELRMLGLEPQPSRANFLLVPVDDPRGLAEALLGEGLVVRVLEDAVRISILDREDDDLLLDALAAVLEPSPGRPRAARRRVRRVRATAETRIAVRLDLDGAGRVRVSTGAGIYDHFLEQLAFHAGLDVVLEGAGDAAETDEHHTAEDAAITLGQGLDAALGDRRGIARYGDAVVPMDDALARAAVDLGGRAATEIRLERDPGLARHVLESLAQNGRLAIHVESTGLDDHHVAEAAFKAVGRALRAALRVEGDAIPSTKGLL